MKLRLAVQNQQSTQIIKQSNQKSQLKGSFIGKHLDCVNQIKCIIFGLPVYKRLAYTYKALRLTSLINNSKLQQRNCNFYRSFELLKSNKTRNVSVKPSGGFVASQDVSGEGDGGAREVEETPAKSNRATSFQDQQLPSCTVIGRDDARPEYQSTPQDGDLSTEPLYISLGGDGWGG